jgi:peptide/nickel transport system permease protein
VGGVSGYLFRRFVQAVLVVLGVILIVFLLSQVVPGGEARAVLGPRATVAQVRQFDRLNGLTDPLWLQFWHYLAGLPQLRLGYSYKFTQPVWAIIRQRLPKTLVLVGVSITLALLIAIPLGVFQVVRRHKPSDYALTSVSFVLYAAPTFFIGTLLIIWFAFDLHVLPVAPPSDASPWAVFTDPRAFVMPVLTLSATTIAAFSRYMRSSLLDAMAEDYIRTARAKGATSRRVLYGHALRNALIPIITLIGLSLPAIVSGAVIVESIFNYPGMGLLVVQAAENTDVPLVLGTTLVATVATVTGSLLADILYVLADPRIRYTGLPA